MIVVSSTIGKERNKYQVQEFDKALKPVSKPVRISNEFDPKLISWKMFCIQSTKR